MYSYTHSFPVKVRFPSIGGIDPTNSFSLKSLQQCHVKIQKTCLEITNVEVIALLRAPNY